MQTILVPTDFSKCSYNAGRYAIALAQETKAKILLLHTYQIPAPPIEAHVSLINLPDLQADSMKRLKAMAEFELKLHENNDLEIEYEAKAGFTVNEIISASQEHRAGMIVMGTQGSSGLKKIIMGSNTANVISKSSCPVLAVPEGSKYHGFKRIVFAADFHEIKDNATLASLEEIALLFNSEILFFSVKKKADDIPSATQVFEGFNFDKVFERIPHSFHTAVSEDVVGEIDSFIEKHNADLLVTMPQKHSYLELFFSKSITRNLVFHSHTPILCLPENQISHKIN